MFWGHSKWWQIRVLQAWTNFCWLRSAKHVKFTEEYVMCTKKHVLIKNNVYKFTKHRFATTSLSWKDSQLSENTLSLRKRKKFLVPQSVKKIMLTVFWQMKGSMTIDFLIKGSSVNSAFYCQIHLMYWIYLEYIYLYIYTIEHTHTHTHTHIYIYIYWPNE